MDILRRLLPPPRVGATLVETYYDAFKEENGVRPLSIEAYHDGYNPRTLRELAGSGLAFVQRKGDLGAGQERLLQERGDFLDTLETTPMARSFKMLALQALLDRDQLPGALPINELVSEFARLAGRSAALTADVSVPLDDRGKLRKYLEKNPVAAWTEGKGTGGRAYFAYESSIFRSTFEVPAELRDDFQGLVREIVDSRLAEYLQRAVAGPHRGFLCRVFHSSGRPILKLPDRARHAGIPEEVTSVFVDGEPCEATLAKVAVNVLTRPGEKKNVLPEVLRRWFGQDVGKLGTAFSVAFEQKDGQWPISLVDADFP